MLHSELELVAHIEEKNLKISHLISPEEKQILQALIEEISAEFDIATTLSDPDGSPVFPYCNFTELCQQHIRGSAEGLKRCKLEASKQGQLSEERGEPIVYQCHAGIIDFTAPIMLLNRRIGNVSGGQVWTERPDAVAIERLNRYFDEIGVQDKTAALAAIASQKVNDPEKIRRLAAIYHNIGKLLSNYFHFQAEYGYWKKSLLSLNAQLEERIRQRTKLLEETVQDLNLAQQLLKSQNDELRRSGEIQSVLREISEAAVLAKSLDELFATVHRLLQRVLPAKNLYISLLDQNTGKIVRPYCVDETNSVLQQRPLGKGVTEYFMALGRAEYINAEEFSRLVEDGEIDNELDTAFDWLGVPLSDSHGQVYGVIIMFSNDRTQSFKKEDSGVLAIIAAQVSMAIERKQAENALRESEEKYRFITENMVDTVWLLDVNSMRYKYVSPSVVNLRGFSQQEVMHSDFSATFASSSAAYHSLILPGQIAAFEAGDERERVKTIDVEQSCKDGGTVSTEVVTRLVTDQAGKVTSVLGVSRDISERILFYTDMAASLSPAKRSEIIAKYQTQLLNQLQEAIVITNRENQIIYWNKTAEALFGYTAEEAHGLDAALLIAGEPNEQVAKRSQIVAATVAGGRSTTEIVACHKDGQTFPAQMFTVLLKDMEGEFSGIATFSVDLSQLRAAEETISKIKRDHERQNFFAQLLESTEPVGPRLLEKAAVLDLKWERPFVLFVLEPSVRTALNRLLGLVQTMDAAIVTWEHKDSLVGVLYLDSLQEELSLLFSRCRENWEKTLTGEFGSGLLMGVADRSESLTGLKSAYAQAKQAVWVCKALDGFGNPCYFKDLGIFQLITPIWDSHLEGFSRQMLAPLLSMKQPKRQEYFETLEALLGAGSQKAAAEKLFVHEKTIQFRKQRIEAALGCSLDNAAQRMALSMAIRCWKNNNTDDFYRQR